MQDDWETWKLFFNLLKNVEAQRGRDQGAFRIAGALLGLEFIGTVAGPDGDRQGIDSSLGYKVDDFGGLCIG